MDPSQMIYSEPVRQAQRFAERAHQGSSRKGGAAILHPVTVATLLAGSGASEELLCAGYLHDVVEDEDVSLAAIEADFGPRVAELVAAVTERTHDDDGGELDWHARKAEAVSHLAATADVEVVLLKAADVCTNIADLLIDLAREGEDVWRRFRASPADQVDYYGRVARLALERMPADAPLAAELGARLAELQRLAPLASRA
jgi:(p)ppGpp synthase/HD superfamily hydrolase